MDLRDDLLPLVRTQGSTNIQRAFEQFHAANPHVYRLLVRLARQATEAGRANLGIGMLYEVIRWNYAIHTTGDVFKLNNNFRSRYVRLIEEREPDLVGVFRMRELRSL
jgi:hypothetical protein